ncbi:MAG: hypothetical protein JW854_11980, partial [Actinobacteria bacterium]|nr:hypothetical protein [Actinomycetota bacterium]
MSMFRKPCAKVKSTIMLLAIVFAAFLALPAAFLLVPGGTRPAQAAPSATPLEEGWVADDLIWSIQSAGDVTYIGGAFDYVGPNTGSGVPLSVISGDPQSPFPRANEAVITAIPDGSGGWFIGGDFTRVGGLTRNRIAHILSDGSVSDWNPGASAEVRALVLSGNTIYAGGDFTTIGGQSRDRIAALNATTGHVTSWNPGSNGTVNTLALSGTTIYAGGSFTTIGGQSRNRIAALNTSTGNATAWDPDADWTVNTLALSGSTVYAGGSFNTVNQGTTPLTRNYIAAFNNTDGTASAWDPNASHPVYALALSGSTVYAGGEFTTIGGQTRNYIAALDATVNTNNATAWNPNAAYYVYALAVSGTTVYAGGYFTSIGGQPRNRIAALDATVNTNSATAWDPDAQSWVLTLALSGTTIYAGGLFKSIGGETRHNIAAIDTDPASPTYGQATAWDPDASGTVYALALSGSTVYAGGQFTSIGGQTRHYIAALDTTTNTNNATAWNPDVDGGIRAIEVSGATVYAGGYFTTVNQGTTPQTRNRLAAFDDTSGTTTAWDPDVNDFVQSIALSGSTVFAGGAFTTVNQGTTPQTRNRLAAFDDTSGTATAWNPDVNNWVEDLAVSGSTVYAGGYFTNVNQGTTPQTRNRLAAFDDTSGTATAWNPNVSGTYVWEIAISGITLYTVGNFTAIGGQSRNHIAAINISDGTVTAWNPDADDAVRAIALSGTTVYAGGDFTNMGGESRLHLAIFVSAPTVDAITPASGASGGMVNVTDLAGSDFRYGAMVTLKKVGQSDIAATNVNVASGAKITCDLDLSGAEVGAWNVVVTNTDGQSGTLAGGFIVEEPSSTWYLAEGCTGGDFETWVLVQNPNDDAVTV